MNARTGRASRGCANSMLATNDPMRPENLPEPEAHAVKRTPQTAIVNATGMVSRRRAPRVTLSDAAVWAFFFLITVASLLAMCILATIVWPAP